MSDPSHNVRACQISPSNLRAIARSGSVTAMTNALLNAASYVERTQAADMAAPLVAPGAEEGGVAPHHEPAQAMAHSGSADGVPVHPVNT
jgi:hypothetical protein